MREVRSRRRTGFIWVTLGGSPWATIDTGQKILLHLAPGTKEDTASGTAFFEDLKRRGLADPLLVVTDGAPGLNRAVGTLSTRLSSSAWVSESIPWRASNTTTSTCT